MSKPSFSTGPSRCVCLGIGQNKSSMDPARRSSYQSLNILAMLVQRSKSSFASSLRAVEGGSFSSCPTRSKMAGRRN